MYITYQFPAVLHDRKDTRVIENRYLYFQVITFLHQPCFYLHNEQQDNSEQILLFNKITNSLISNKCLFLKIVRLLSSLNSQLTTLRVCIFCPGFTTTRNCAIDSQTCLHVCNTLLYHFFLLPFKYTLYYMNVLPTITQIYNSTIL